MATWVFNTATGYMLADFGPLATGDNRLPEIPTVSLPADMAGLEWGFVVPLWGAGPTSYLQRTASGVVSGVTWELDVFVDPPLLDTVPVGAHFVVMAYNSTKTEFAPSITPEQAAPPAYATGGLAPNPSPSYRFGVWDRQPDYTHRDYTQRQWWNTAQSAFKDKELWPEQVYDAYAGVGHVNNEQTSTNAILSSVFDGRQTTTGADRRASANYGLWKVDLSAGGQQFYADPLPPLAIGVQYEWDEEETVSYDVDLECAVEAKGTGDTGCTLYRCPASLDISVASWGSHGATTLLTAGTTGVRQLFNLAPSYGTSRATRKLVFEIAIATVRDRRIFAVDEFASAGMSVISAQVNLRPARYRFVYPLRVNPLRQRQRQDGLAISAPRQFTRNRPKSKQISVRAGWEGTYL